MSVYVCLKGKGSLYFVLIVWLLNITEHHCVNTPNSNSLFTHCLRRNKKQRPTPWRKSL